jgi:hypothetical protein
LHIPNKKEGTIIKIIIEKGCGLDEHKRTVVTRIMEVGIKKEIRTNTTMTNDLLRLEEWLQNNGITHVAMEITGVYWKPVFNILEDHFEVILVNARHAKNVPGRKTDIQDSEWLCRLLRSGLVSGSFIPSWNIRESKDLTRHKTKVIQTITTEMQRIEKVLEDANITLSFIASDTFEASGKRIIEDLIKGKLPFPGYIMEGHNGTSLIAPSGRSPLKAWRTLRA